MSYASVGPYTFNYTITRTTNQAVPGSDVANYLEIEITSGIGPSGWSDAFIFLYQRDLADEDGNYTSMFTNVCTPVDMEEVTAKAEPAVSAAQPLQFRLNYVRAYFRSMFDLEQTLQDILQDIQELANGLALQSRYLQEPTTGYIVSA